MKKLIHYFIRIILGILLLIISYGIVGVLLSIISTNPPEVACEHKQEIYVTSNGVHLDLLIPKKLLDERLLKELKLPGQVNYVSFGWGDKAFYMQTPTWDQFKLPVAMKAVFLKGDAAMHITYYHNKRKKWTRVRLCERQVEQLQEYVMNTFKKNDEGQIMEIKGAGYTKYDKFYEAKGNYSFITTCNQWVNAGLQHSDIRTSLWSPFDFGVLYQLENGSTKEEVNH